MKTAPSSALNERCRAALARSCAIRGLRLVRDGESLVIDGAVPSYREKKLAGTAAARVLGVSHIVNRLRVVPQGQRSVAQWGFGQGRSL